MLQAHTLHDALQASYGPVVPLLSKSLRAQFIAAPGHKLYGGDYSNIEGRLNAWICGQNDKLDAFAAYDRKEGANLYSVGYGKSFGVDPFTVRKGSTEYDIGKKQELACGYQGSVGAFLRFATRAEISKITAVVMDMFYGNEAWQKAADQHDRATKHYDLPPNEWISIKLIVNAWRAGNPHITQSWWDLQDAAIAAVDAPGIVVPVLQNRIRYLVHDGALWCRLPSGKMLVYQRPRLVEVKEEFLVDEEGEQIAIEDLSADEIEEKRAAGWVTKSNQSRLQVAFDGKNQKTGHWSRQFLYGGLQMNNVVQATARELLRLAMIAVEFAGYPIVLHVHDEIVSEIPERSNLTLERFEELMLQKPAWLTNFPLSAGVWESDRYVK